jgi:hypothetical protein
MQTDSCLQSANSNIFPLAAQLPLAVPGILVHPKLGLLAWLGLHHLTHALKTPDTS